MPSRRSIPQRRGTVVAVCVLALAAASAPVVQSTDPFPADHPGVEIGRALQRGFEPSGAVWHTRLSKLFVVDDEGWLAMMNADGSNIRTWRVGGDLEGVSVVDPSSDRIWLGIEHPDSIAEFDFVRGELLRVFDLTPWMRGPASKGLEALTWVPGRDGASGRFHAGLQQDGRIYVFELSTDPDDDSTEVVHVTTLTPQAGLKDISGLHYDAGEAVLYAIFDKPNLLMALRTDGSRLATWFLPGKAQEGLARNGEVLFVADDDDGVLRYTGFDPSGMER